MSVGGEVSDRARPRDLELAREYARRLRARLGDNLVAVTLYGSRARGDAREGSDFDLIVEVRERTDEVRELVLELDVEMMNEFEELFVGMVYDEGNGEGRGDPRPGVAAASPIIPGAQRATPDRATRPLKQWATHGRDCRRCPTFGTEPERCVNVRYVYVPKSKAAWYIAARFAQGTLGGRLFASRSTKRPPVVIPDERMSRARS